MTTPTEQEIKLFHALCDEKCWSTLIDDGEYISDITHVTSEAFHAGRAPLLSRIKELEALCLLSLYHHQGGSSPVGQPIRKALGIGQHDHMTPEQYAIAKSFGPVDDISQPITGKDAERLDWLEENKYHLWGKLDTRSNGVVWVTKSLRETIDAAIAQGSKP